MDNVASMSDRMFGYFESIVALPAEQRRRMATLLQHTRIERGDHFVRAGEKNDTIGYIHNGLLKHYYIDTSAKEFTRYFCVSGQFVSSGIGDNPSQYSVQAIETTDLLLVARIDWLELVETHPCWGRVALAIQEYALGLAEQRERSLVLDDALTRYLKILEEIPDIEQRVKQYDIASYLGITPVALSRIRGRPIPKYRAN